MNQNKKPKLSDYWNMGTAIGLCAAAGILLGALLNNLVFWLCGGAAVGVVLGAVTQLIRNKGK
jgi:ABC-type Mn2+/Zn2+ transport system permease subunit